MIRHLTIHLVLCALGFTLHTGELHAQQTAPVNRQPVFAGSFYQGSKQALEAALKELYASSSPKQLDGKVRSLIVPHAGYTYSGRVAASGYKSIPKDAEYENIFIIASSHREIFKGASVYSVGNYLTPLGEAIVNRTIARDLIASNKDITYNKSAHDREHSIEVQVPLIQYHFNKTPPIVPIVIGSSSVSAARDLATALLPYFTPENLFVISSDFSHYPGYDEATKIDRLTGDAILQNNPEIFYNTLRKNSNAGVQNLATPCCGWTSVLTLLYMTEKNPQVGLTPILYQNSGDAPIGDKERVVGYWAIAGHEIPSEMSQYVLNEKDKEILMDISKETLHTYTRTREIPEVTTNELPDILRLPAGAFVSLYKHGQLRGCIGNFLPDEPLYQVVQHMTVAASTRDTRFYPVDPWELEEISIEISVLTPLQRIESIDEFQLGRHGIYMRKNGKSGTYLPQVAAQTDWDKEDFLGHCAKDKAKIGWNGWKDADLFVYEAIVFGDQH